ncbi:MAG TPA: flagellar hook-basal body complex protein FliE [Ruminococcaceae bacterium]|jgi:flagellar hook-basal body complex protein FliE|nr:flagellar hook-basal body complex protein FliE [Oscillospiraceae bacterium]HCC02241.1 flagellar hook-basal body complex protein FliE [Oscillospiraceae bacterium]HCM22994.1 flagellar hook-basal body complex protein FliE [Oscillospiraceae bacterium]
MTFGTIPPIQPMQFGTTKTPATTGNVSNVGLPFSDVLKNAVNTLQQTQAVSAQDSYNLATGNTDNLAQIMVNSAKETAAVQFTTELCTRAVNAYKEIMQMQV